MNYYKVLNAKNYGIPQNRERIFVISIRKDIDKGYEFPKPQELQLCLKDILEENVDEKFYLKQTKVGQFEKAGKVNSNSQLYKQAGNSIVVNVLEEIFNKMREYKYIK